MSFQIHNDRPVSCETPGSPYSRHRTSREEEEGAADTDYCAKQGDLKLYPIVESLFTVPWSSIVSLILSCSIPRCDVDRSSLSSVDSPLRSVLLWAL